MNERINELSEQALAEFKAENKYATIIVPNPLKEKFAELLIKECVNTLEFHGYDDAVPYVKWMATNKLGVKE